MIKRRLFVFIFIFAQNAFAKLPYLPADNLWPDRVPLNKAADKIRKQESSSNDLVWVGLGSEYFEKLNFNTMKIKNTRTTISAIDLRVPMGILMSTASLSNLDSDPLENIKSFSFTEID